MPKESTLPLLKAVCVVKGLEGTSPLSPQREEMKGTFLVVAILVAASVAVATDYSKYNLRVGKKYLDEKSKEDGVVKTSSGLMYKVVKKADASAGEPPKANDQVKVHYRGRLINGKVGFLKIYVFNLGLDEHANKRCPQH